MDLEISDWIPKIDRSFQMTMGKIQGRKLKMMKILLVPLLLLGSTQGGYLPDSSGVAQNSNRVRQEGDGQQSTALYNNRRWPPPNHKNEGAQKRLAFQHKGDARYTYTYPYQSNRDYSSQTDMMEDTTTTAKEDIANELAKEWKSRNSDDSSKNQKNRVDTNTAMPIVITKPVSNGVVRDGLDKEAAVEKMESLAREWAELNGEHHRMMSSFTFNRQQPKPLKIMSTTTVPKTKIPSAQELLAKQWRDRNRDNEETQQRSPTSAPAARGSFGPGPGPRSRMMMMSPNPNGRTTTTPWTTPPTTSVSPPKPATTTTVSPPPQKPASASSAADLALEWAARNKEQQSQRWSQGGFDMFMPPSPLRVSQEKKKKAATTSTAATPPQDATTTATTLAKEWASVNSDHPVVTKNEFMPPPAAAAAPTNNKSEDNDAPPAVATVAKAETPPELAKEGPDWAAKARDEIRAAVASDTDINEEQVEEDFGEIDTLLEKLQHVNQEIHTLKGDEEDVEDSSAPDALPKALEKLKQATAVATDVTAALPSETSSSSSSGSVGSFIASSMISGDDLFNGDKANRAPSAWSRVLNDPTSPHFKTPDKKADAADDLARALDDYPVSHFDGPEDDDRMASVTSDDNSAPPDWVVARMESESPDTILPEDASSACSSPPTEDPTNQALPDEVVASMDLEDTAPTSLENPVVEGYTAPLDDAVVENTIAPPVDESTHPGSGIVSGTTDDSFVLSSMSRDDPMPTPIVKPASKNRKSASQAAAATSSAATNSALPDLAIASMQAHPGTGSSESVKNHVVEGWTAPAQLAEEVETTADSPSKVELPSTNHKSHSATGSSESVKNHVVEGWTAPAPLAEEVETTADSSAKIELPSEDRTSPNGSAEETDASDSSAAIPESPVMDPAKDTQTAPAVAAPKYPPPDWLLSADSKHSSDFSAAVASSSFSSNAPAWVTAGSTLNAGPVAEGWTSAAPLAANPEETIIGVSSVKPAVTSTDTKSSSPKAESVSKRLDSRLDSRAPLSSQVVAPSAPPAAPVGSSSTGNVPAWVTGATTDDTVTEGWTMAAPLADEAATYSPAKTADNTPAAVDPTSPDATGTVPEARSATTPSKAMAGKSKSAASPPPRQAVKVESMSTSPSKAVFSTPPRRWDNRNLNKSTESRAAPATGKVSRSSTLSASTMAARKRSGPSVGTVASSKNAPVALPVDPNPRFSLIALEEITTAVTAKDNKAWGIVLQQQAEIESLVQKLEKLQAPKENVSSPIQSPPRDVTAREASSSAIAAKWSREWTVTNSKKLAGRAFVVSPDAQSATTVASTSTVVQSAEPNVKSRVVSVSEATSSRSTAKSSPTLANRKKPSAATVVAPPANGVRAKRSVKKRSSINSFSATSTGGAFAVSAATFSRPRSMKSMKTPTTKSSPSRPGSSTAQVLAETAFSTTAPAVPKARVTPVTKSRPPPKTKMQKTVPTDHDSRTSVKGPSLTAKAFNAWVNYKDVSATDVPSSASPSKSEKCEPRDITATEAGSFAAAAKLARRWAIRKRKLDNEEPALSHSVSKADEPVPRTTSATVPEMTDPASTASPADDHAPRTTSTTIPEATVPASTASPADPADTSKATPVEKTPVLFKATSVTEEKKTAAKKLASVATIAKKFEKSMLEPPTPWTLPRNKGASYPKDILNDKEEIKRAFMAGGIASVVAASIAADSLLDMNVATFSAPVNMEVAAPPDEVVVRKEEQSVSSDDKKESTITSPTASSLSGKAASDDVFVPRLLDGRYMMEGATSSEDAIIQAKKQSQSSSSPLPTITRDVTKSLLPKAEKVEERAFVPRLLHDNSLWE